MDLNIPFWKYEDNIENPTDDLKEVSAQVYKELIAKVIINRKVQEVIATVGLKGYNTNVIYCTIATLKLLYGETINHNTVWKNNPSRINGTTL
jgi:hypothetical protein